MVMRSLRNSVYVLAALAAIAAASGCSASGEVIIEDPPDGSLTVDNQSDFRIVEIRVTSVGSSTWGPNLLDGDVLLPGEVLTLEVQCDVYDALLVDEDGVDCEINSIDLCLNDADWVIRNNTCSVFGAAKAAREAAAKAAAEAAGSAKPDAGSATTDAGTQ
jgi:hypothetical protein